MTYCVGIMTREGLVMASDSRSNAGYDQVNICRKMHLFVHPGERVFVLLTSGSLSVTQSVITLLRDQFDAGDGLASAPNFYAATRVVGECVRRVADLDREALERDDFKFNINLIIGGQIKDQPAQLNLVYPQGNPMSATEDSPFLQIGECKYGRPILDRGIVYDSTPLDVASLYALLSFDATMRSNVTVGPPIEILVYRRDDLEVREHKRFFSDDVQLNDIHQQWERSLRRAVEHLPKLVFDAPVHTHA